MLTKNPIIKKGHSLCIFDWYCGHRLPQNTDAKARPSLHWESTNQKNEGRPKKFQSADDILWQNLLLKRLLIYQKLILLDSGRSQKNAFRGKLENTII